MNRSQRIALLIAGVLLVGAVGTVLATRTLPADRQTAPLAASHEPGANEEADALEAPPSAEDVAHAVDRLEASEIAVSADVVTALAERYGLGGAVRLIAWSDETGLSIDDLAAKRDDGMGWGRIARELGVHPGIGSIMGNGGGNGKGAGRDNAPGQQTDE